jgi:hypothetical protein
MPCAGQVAETRFLLLSFWLKADESPPTFASDFRPERADSEKSVQIGAIRVL